MSYKDPEMRRAGWRKASAAYRDRHPAKVAAANLTYGQGLGLAAHRARGRVSDAVTNGRLVRLPCEVCGTPQVEAHHPFGYDGLMALAVWWLCNLHHDAMHLFINLSPTRRGASLVTEM